MQRVTGVSDYSPLSSEYSIIKPRNIGCALILGSYLYVTKNLYHACLGTSTFLVIFTIFKKCLEFREGILKKRESEVQEKQAALLLEHSQFNSDPAISLRNSQVELMEKTEAMLTKIRKNNETNFGSIKIKKEQIKSTIQRVKEIFASDRPLINTCTKETITLLVKLRKQIEINKRAAKKACDEEARNRRERIKKQREETDEMALGQETKTHEYVHQVELMELPPVPKNEPEQTIQEPFELAKIRKKRESLEKGIVQHTKEAENAKVLLNQLWADWLTEMERVTHEFENSNESASEFVKPDQKMTHQDRDTRLKKKTIGERSDGCNAASSAASGSSETAGAIPSSPAAISGAFCSSEPLHEIKPIATKKRTAKNLNILYRLTARIKNTCKRCICCCRSSKTS